MDSIVYALVSSRLDPAICPANTDYLCNFPPIQGVRVPIDIANQHHVRHKVAYPESLELPLLVEFVDFSKRVFKGYASVGSMKIEDSCSIRLESCK